jgi:hypothetical protein
MKMAIEVLLKDFSLEQLTADESGDDLVAACYEAAEKAGIDVDYIDIAPAAELKRDIAAGATPMVGFGVTVAEGRDVNGDCVAIFYINR